MRIKKLREKKKVVRYFSVQANQLSTQYCWNSKKDRNKYKICYRILDTTEIKEGQLITTIGPIYLYLYFINH